jgi:hypothetical protein
MAGRTLYVVCSEVYPATPHHQHFGAETRDAAKNRRVQWTFVRRINDIATLRAWTTGQRGEENITRARRRSEVPTFLREPSKTEVFKCLKRLNQPVEVDEIPGNTD